MKTIFFSDIDGTLLDNNKSIRTETTRTIKAFEGAGGFFSLATGRSVSESREIATKCAVNLPCVLLNGALVYDFIQQKSLWSVPIQDEIWTILLHLVDKLPDVAVAAYTADGDHCLQVNEILKTRSIMTDRLFPVSRLSEIKGPILKVTLVGESHRLIIARRLFDPMLFNSCQSSKHFLEITSKTASKATAARHIAINMGIPLDDCCAAGDAENDIELLKAVGTAFVMGNASDQVKIHATHIVASNADDGLAQALRSCLMHHGLTEKLFYSFRPA